MRLNFYRNGSSFIEFFNPSWNLMKGEASFSLRFGSGFTVSFRGKSWGDSYTHDFTDKTMVQALFGLLVKEKSVQLLNATARRSAPSHSPARKRLFRTSTTASAASSSPAFADGRT